MPNFIGWLVGVMLGLVLIIAIFVALALPIPPVVGFLAALVAAVTSVVGTVTPTVALILAGVLLVSFYLWAYAIATSSVAVGLPALPIPPGNVLTPSGAPVALPAFDGELFARGVMIGQTAVLNAAILSLVPAIGPILAIWAFAIVSLAAVILIARNRVFQGFLGWSAWLFPMSYLATALGLLLFLCNAPFALWTIGIGAFRIDWTTGVIETTGGAVAIVAGFTDAFSLGNFNFVTLPANSGSFTAPSIPSHETGHTLNTAAMSGVVLWINAIDENIWPFSWNLAYGELTAESHSQDLVGAAPRPFFFVRLWS